MSKHIYRLICALQHTVLYVQLYTVAKMTRMTRMTRMVEDERAMMMEVMMAMAGGV